MSRLYSRVVSLRSILRNQTIETTVGCNRNFSATTTQNSLDDIDDTTSINDPSYRPNTLFSEKTPILQDKKDVNMIYVSKFSNTWYTDLLKKNVIGHLELSREKSFLIRNIGVTIIADIRSALNRNKPYKKLLHGEKGVGKSALLNYLAIGFMEGAAQEKLDAIVVHIPSVLYITRYPITITASRWMSSRFDQNHHAIKLMNDFKMNNLSILKRLNLKTNSNYNIHGVEIKAGTPLMKIIDMGVGPFDFKEMEFEPAASDMYGIVLKELREQKGIPVILAIDDFNACYNLSCIKDFFLHKVHANRLTLIHQLRKMWECENPKIIKVAATSATGHYTSLPVGKLVCEMIDEVGEEVGNYNQEEIIALLEYYRLRRSSSFGSEKIAEVKMLTSSIPEEVYRLARKL